MKLCIVYCIYVRVSYQLMVRTTACGAGVDVRPQLMLWKEQLTRDDKSNHGAIWPAGVC
jgi:hypothetical protein